MMVYGHASRLSGLGGDAESQQSRSSSCVARRMIAQPSTKRPNVTVRATKQQKQTVVDAAVQQWAGFAHRAGVSGQVSVPRGPVFFYPVHD
jgi:hypothetical protein